MKQNYILFLLVGLLAWTTNAQVTLTQSVDDGLVEAGGVACWASALGEYRDNSFFRAYDLSDFGITDDFGITSVEYGQGSADDNKEIVCNIYTSTSTNLTTATLTLVETAMHVSAAADDLTMISVPLTATIPAGSIIVFEVFAAGAGTTLNSTFFPGINGAGENDTSWIQAPDCGITSPSTLASIGQTDEYVMNVVGNVLSVEEFSLENSVSIYPNPTNDIITVDVANAINVNSLEIFNIVGKRVMKTNTAGTVDLSDLNAGVYMLRVQTDEGVVTKKVIRN